ncbi:MAG: hypothetical protein ABIP48_15030 [Planctomycetota bacterium]
MSRAVVLLAAIGFAGMVALSSLGGPPPETAGQENDASSGQETDASDDDDDDAMIDPMGPNAACYVCHTTFVYEELSNVHLPEKVTCVRCHGISAAHANDEKIGATLPDITFKRDKIDAACSTADCHAKHDAPARKIIARWLERKPPESPAVCTDCHGMHKIERPEESGESDPSLVPAGTPSA